MMGILLALVLAHPDGLTSRQTEEIRKVESRLLAPCCYTQSIAVHGSDIAVQMRGEVAEMVAHGETEEQIVSHYRNIYGERILIVPDGLTGRILFSVPLLTSALGCLVLFVCLQRMLRSGRERPATIVDQAMHEVKVDKALRDQITREMGETL